jgi:aryl-alcohol dehydrogenase-like predicted oxidoreductase
VQRRRLGRTGHESSLAILGAAAYWDADTTTSAPTFTAALAAGVNHLDIAPQYGNAQRALGPLVAERRGELFVACKTLRTNPDGVRAQCEESLRLLGCDAFDLYQAHAVTSVAELDRRMPALEAIVALRADGVTRFAGITGHGPEAPAAHLEALRRLDLDTVMFPVNARLFGDPAYREAADALLAECARRDLGVMAIKAVAKQPWPDGAERTASTWYEPYRDPERIARGVRYTLSVPGVHAFCTPGDRTLLPLAVEAADAFVPMPDDERRAVEAEVAELPLLGLPG